MDTNKTEKLLQTFEQEISNIADIASLKKDIQILNQELFTCCRDLKNAADELERNAEELKSMGKDFSRSLSDLHRRIDGINQNIETQLHHALTRYETFLRSELLLIKDQIKLDLKESSNEHHEKSNELKLLIEHKSKKIFNFLIIFIGLFLLTGVWYIWF